MNQVALIELPTNTLLEKFGSETHAPGSGSAAALMGLLSAKLIVTVTKISLRKAEYQRDHAKIEFVAGIITTKIEPLLRDLFQRDATIFDEVIKARIARDSSTNDRERRKFGDLALEKLKQATDIPFQIGETCLALIDHGTAVFDMGFKGARGDTGAAISASVAGAMAAIFVINLNLKSFRGSAWAMQQRKRCDDMHKLLTRKQLEAYSRVMTLRDEDISSVSFNFDEESAS